MALNVNTVPQTDPTQNQASQAKAHENHQQTPLSATEQSDLAQSMARDRYRAREKAQNEEMWNHFLEDHGAILQGRADGAPPAAHAAGAVVAGAAAKAGSPPVPAALQNLVADRAPTTPAYGQLQHNVSQAVQGGAPLQGQQTYALAHTVVKQMGIMTPAQMAPLDRAVQNSSHAPTSALNRSFALSGVGAGAAGGSAALAVANSGSKATTGSNSTTAPTATDPSVGAPSTSGTTAATNAGGLDASTLNMIYTGSIQSVMMMVLAGSMKESMAEKQDGIKDLAKYSKISELLGNVLTQKLGPAQEELNNKVAKAKSADAAKQQVTIKDYPQGIDLENLDTSGSEPKLKQNQPSKDVRANTAEMNQLTAELTQEQTTLQNKQTIATNKINSKDSQVNNTQGQMSQFLKTWNDTASTIGRNI